MPRIELLMCVFAGLSGGLVGVLWNGLVTMPWLAARRSATVPATRPESGLSLLANAILLALGGAALGFLFWLGWALVALVNTPWYATGLLFGLLVWTGIALPLVGGLALRVRDFGGVARMCAVEWLVTCLAVGLFCAFAWHRYA
jgi:hypothetical protein